MAKKTHFLVNPSHYKTPVHIVNQMGEKISNKIVQGIVIFFFLQVIEESHFHAIQ